MLLRKILLCLCLLAPGLTIGQNLVKMKAGMVAPGTIVDVKKIAEMVSIVEKKGGFTIGAATPAAAGGEPRGESAPTPTPAAGGQGPDADTTRIQPLSKTATQRNFTFTVNPLLLLAQRDGRRRQFAAPAAPAAPALPATPALATPVVKEELGGGDARARTVEKQPGGGGDERRLVFTMNPLRKRSTGGFGSRGAE